MTETLPTNPTPNSQEATILDAPSQGDIAKENGDINSLDDLIAAMDAPEDGFTNDNVVDDVTSKADEKIVNEVKPKVKEKPKKEEPTALEPKIVKLKFDGKEEDYNINDHAKVIKDLQLSKAATKRFQDAEALKQEAISIANLMNTNPSIALKQLGWTDAKVDEWMTNHLYSRIEQSNMSPKEKELLQREQVLKDQETRRQIEEQQKADGTYKEKFHQTTQQIEQAIITTFQNRKDLPRNQKTAARVLQYMNQAVERGLPIDVNDCFDQVKQDYIDEAKSIYGETDEDNLLTLLGDDVVKKVNKGLVKKVKKPEQKIQQNKQAPKRKVEPETFDSKESFFAHLGKK